mgnify:CR=1 FL=1
MKYELAKELKEAGFPDSGNWTIGEVFGEGLQCFYDDGDSIHYKPTLSELIDACKEDFVTLRKTSNGWEAIGHKVVEGKERTIACFGETAEIAVANLWLLLNEKV